MKFTELKIYASTMGLEAVGGVLDSAGEITEALESCGFCPTGAVQENDWVSLTAQRANG